MAFEDRAVQENRFKRSEFVKPADANMSYGGFGGSHL